MKTKMKPWIEVVLVLFILGSLTAILGPAVFRTETLPWNVGRPIPEEPPAEDRRVYSDPGLSIAMPPNWTAKRLEGRIILAPKQSIPSRSKAMIVFQGWPDAPSDLNDSQPSEIAGLPAHLKIEQRRSTFDDPALTTWRYFLQYRGDWFEASYSIAAAHNEIPSLAKQYLESIRFEERQ